MLVGAIPSWPHSRSWGYGPSGGLGLVLVAVIVLVLLGRVWTDWSRPRAERELSPSPTHSRVAL